MEIVLWSIAALLGAQLLFALWNVRQLPSFGKPDDMADDTADPDQRYSVHESSLIRLSILIPARDEERHIGGCLQAISACLPADAADIEIIVLDDGSTDATAYIARAYAEADCRFRVAAGAEKPADWVGKAYACHQLAQLARGSWLWFIDADARMQPGAIQAIGRELNARSCGLISGFPRQQTGSWLERLVVPMMGFTIACHLPIRLVSASRDPRFAAAHGGWIGIHRATYALAGGHAANRGELVDDVALMRAVKRAGHPVALADVRMQVTMRMYRSAAEVWSGYTKNIYAGLGRSGSLLFAVLSLYALLYLLPLAVLPTVWLYPALAPPALTAYVLGAGVKAVADRSQSQPLWLAPLVPLSIAAVIAIGAASWLAAKSGRGYEWKGRSYE
jgi:glycosyltransferase involved in cell wall biosynthesis